MIPLMTRHRHTIMDGRVVEFATGFEYAGPSLGGDRHESTGPFEVSASRNMVMVHRAECTTREQLAVLVEALKHAWDTHLMLVRCGGRPRDDGCGSPRPVVCGSSSDGGVVHERGGVR